MPQSMVHRWLGLTWESQNPSFHQPRGPEQHGAPWVESAQNTNQRKYRPNKAGWWYTYPSEKYEFVSWGYDIPNITQWIWGVRHLSSSHGQTLNHLLVGGLEHEFYDCIIFTVQRLGVFGMVVSLFAKISCRLVGSTSNCPRGGLKPSEGSPPSNWHRPGQTRVGRLVSSKAVLRVYDGLC